MKIALINENSQGKNPIIRKNQQKSSRTYGALP